MRRARGQSLIEFVLVLNIFIVFLLGIAEYGLAFSHHLTLEYATREGARTGGALGVGTEEIDCADIDNYVIAAVQRVLTSPGSPIDVNRVAEIRIFKATSTGQESGGSVNVWTLGSGPAVDGAALLFAPGAQGWPACTRLTNSNPDSMGVKILYDYDYVTPVAEFLGVAGVTSFRMTDQTVMAMNPI